MIFGNAKDALDAGWIADADLDICLVEETGPLIDRAALRKEYSLDRIEGLQRRLKGCPDVMKIIDDCAVQFAKQSIRSTAIPGHRFSRFAGRLDENVIGRLDGGNAGRGCQVKAKSQIENGTHDKRFAELAAIFLFSRKLDTPQRIGFPEVDA